MKELSEHETETPQPSEARIHDDEHVADYPDVELEDDEHPGEHPAPEVLDGEAGPPATEAQAEVEHAEPAELAGQPKTIQINLSPLITLVLGLVLGFLAGFVGRPWLMPQPQIPIATTRGNVAQGSPAATPQSAAQASLPETPTGAASESTNEAADREAALQQIMDALIVQTRHFKGNPDAPVTVLEFSDFQ